MRFDVRKCLFFCLFSTVDVDDLVLVDVLEDVGRVHEDANGADGRYDEEHVQLKPIYHHGHKLPVLSDLKKKHIDF